MVTVLSQQSLLDLAIQTAGDVTAVIGMMIANDIPVTEILVPGQELQTVEAVNRDIATYYNNKRLTPATAITANLADSRIFDNTFNNFE